MGSLSWGSFFIACGVICGLVGWAVIEFVLWLFSFVHVTIG